ncbi:Gfo/Idh/MocA family protein [Paenibacillus mendelii]|uniref:Gfo/Idh/MocA family protein n=1 Tax=Paenibacillus mendelii TaxID=206163 RepID=A0ABV6JDI3_9BACL|nr:Gfo/Idh/MocA family oxidoreductase [Paenibacillus mendelii]MCQ6562395.1 Gfo/Idh/MocA family oxidoreductase [Paenibacillus mendelii]
MNIGLIGCGAMGRVYVDRLMRMKGVQVTAICHPEREKAAALAEVLQARIYESYSEMIARPDIDIICVTLPTYLHKEYVQQALEAGKHVICEKPLALTEEDCAELIKTSRIEGVRLCVAHVVRFFPEYRDARRRLLSGEVGAVKSVRTTRASLMPLENSWFLDKRKSGGVVFDLMIHDIDYALWLLGDQITQISAEIITHEGVEQVLAWLYYADGTTVRLGAVWGAAEFHAGFDITGDQGVLSFGSVREDMESGNKAVHENLSDRGVIIPEASELEDPYYCQLLSFIRAIETNSPLPITAEEACSAVRIANRIVGGIGS